MNSSNRIPFSIDLKIPSLSADSAADYKAATCLNSDYAMSSSAGNKSQGLALGAATAIHYSVETELLAAQLVDDIQVLFIAPIFPYVHGKFTLF